MSSQLYSPDLSALLAAHSQTQQMLASQLLSGMGLPNNAPSMNAGAASASSELLNLLLRHQAEERQKALLTQQIASLSGLASLSIPPPPVDNLSLLLQQKQLQSLQSLTNAGSTLDRLAALRGATAAQSDFGLLGVQSQNQLEALSKILKISQQQQPTAQTDLNAASLTIPLDRKRKGRTGTFPQKLHQILLDLQQQEGGSEIAAFLPHGRAFAILKPREFVKHVMPKYFRMSRFSSFQRQLNLYDFQRVTEGPDKGAYYHELFVQGRPILSTMMKRNKIKGVKNGCDGQSNEGDADDDQETASR